MPAAWKKFVARPSFAEFPGRIGPAALSNAGAGNLTQKQCLEIWHKIPSSHWHDILPESTWHSGSHPLKFNGRDRVFQEEEIRLAAALAKLNRQVFVEVATAAAETSLAAYLASLCNEVNRHPWILTATWKQASL